MIFNDDYKVDVGTYIRVFLKENLHSCVSY